MSDLPPASEMFVLWLAPAWVPPGTDGLVPYAERKAVTFGPAERGFENLAIVEWPAPPLCRAAHVPISMEAFLAEGRTAPLLSTVPLFNLPAIAPGDTLVFKRGEIRVSFGVVA
jgi:hypothetical protein